MVYCLLRYCYCAVFHKALCWVHFSYADDTQIYTSFVVEDIAQFIINCSTKLYAGNPGLEESKHAET